MDRSTGNSRTTKRFDPEDFAAFLALLPSSVGGLPIRHAVEVRHDSFRSPDFVALARAHGVAIVIAADGEYPQIGDVTAPFVYARIMGTTEAHPFGYSSRALGQWASARQDLGRRGAPSGIATVAAPAPGKKSRDVFLYVISGYKALNPAAAMALIERVG